MRGEKQSQLSKHDLGKLAPTMRLASAVRIRVPRRRAKHRDNWEMVYPRDDSPARPLFTALAANLQARTITKGAPAPVGESPGLLMR
jgi:hypothetical protein